MQRFKLKVKAFTLSELLVVLIIIGILVLIALPKLMPLITKARTTEAKTNLKAIYTMQKSYFYEHLEYAPDLATLDFELENPSEAKYDYEIIEITESEFLIQATAKVDFDQDGNINVWTIDQKGELIEKVKD